MHNPPEIVLQVSCVLVYMAAGALGLAVLAGGLVALVRGLARMGVALDRAGGRAALAGVGVLSLACLLWAQKSPTSLPRGTSAPHAVSARSCVASDDDDVGLSLPYEVDALPPTFPSLPTNALHLTGVEVVPDGVVLGAGWPAGHLLPGEPVDVLARESLVSGDWRIVAAATPAAGAAGMTVGLPDWLLPGNRPDALFFALRRGRHRDTDGDGVPDSVLVDDRQGLLGTWVNDGNRS